MAQAVIEKDQSCLLKGFRTTRKKTNTRDRPIRSFIVRPIKTELSFSMRLGL